MGLERNKFSSLDTEKHTRVADAIKSAVSAGFVAEKNADPSGETFIRKSITHFVREKIDLKDLEDDNFSNSNKEKEFTDGPENADAATYDAEVAEATETEAKDTADELNELLDDTSVEGDIAETEVREEDQKHAEVYDEGFAAGRAAALSELEEQRIEHLNVLKSISERLQNESCFDFDDISSKVLDTVYSLSSERCGLAVDSNPQGFIDHVEKQLDQIRSLSNEKKVSFNPEDLKTLQSFEEFETFFKGVDIREDESLNRGDVIVKVGGVEIRDTPFSDHENR